MGGREVESKTQDQTIWSRRKDCCEVMKRRKIMHSGGSQSRILALQRPFQVFGVRCDTYECWCHQ